MNRWVLWNFGMMILASTTPPREKYTTVVALFFLVTALVSWENK